MQKREHSTRALKQVESGPYLTGYNPHYTATKKKKNLHNNNTRVCYDYLPSATIFRSSTCEKIKFTSNKLAAYFRTASQSTFLLTVLNPVKVTMPQYVPSVKTSNHMAQDVNQWPAAVKAAMKHKSDHVFLSPLNILQFSRSISGQQIDCLEDLRSFPLLLHPNRLESRSMAGVHKAREPGRPGGQ